MEWMYLAQDIEGQGWFVPEYEVHPLWRDEGTVTEHNNFNNGPSAKFLGIRSLIYFISFTCHFPQILLTLGDRLLFEWVESSVGVGKPNEFCVNKTWLTESVIVIE